MSLEYLIDLKKDLVTQFQDQPNIDVLVEAVQNQLQDVCVFYEQLRDLRSIDTAQGAQLDGIGEIAVLSRADAGEMASYKEPTFVMEDEEYRKYLLFKIWKNTNACTYKDIQTAFRMFWDKPLYYSEYPNQPLDTQYPATMVFESSVCSPDDHVEKLFDLPFIKAAGVAVIIIAYTEAEEMNYTLGADSLLGQGYMETTLPPVFKIGDLIVWTEKGYELHISWDQINNYGETTNIHMEAEDFEASGRNNAIYLQQQADYLTYTQGSGLYIISRGIRVSTNNQTLYIQSSYINMDADDEESTSDQGSESDSEEESE